MMEMPVFRVILLSFMLSLHARVLRASSSNSEVFLDAEEANSFLSRKRRSNQLFEELSPGNRERECVEESCGYEEAFEISDNVATAQKLWIKLTACKREVIPSGRRRRRRQSTNQQKILLRRCLDDPNHCSPNPCVKDNTMLCEDMFGSYRCVCRPGFEGDKCERSIDYCSSSTCQDPGTDRCENAVGTHRCVCKAGFTGEQCETSLDYCLSKPCDRRGTNRCVSSPGSFQCNCNDGYTGERCETDIDDCVGSPCLNEGTCLDGLMGFICVCDELHFGLQCEQEVDDCRNKGCSTHGDCLPAGGGVYSCQCAEGFQGPNCDEDIDECALSPPCEQNCTNTVGSFRCVCREGYLVNLPDLYSCKDIDECVGNQGCDFRCVNTIGSFNCICDVGYEVDSLFGRYCRDIDECGTDNGGCADKCVNNLGSFFCTCRKGFEPLDGGSSCQDIDECARGHTCQHGCMNSPGSFQCTCPDGYIMNYDKRTCRDINECSLPESPCEHRCQNSVGGFQCICNKGFTMNDVTQRCDDVDECADNPCSHDCENTAGSYTCVCNTGFELVGRKCFNINDCKSSPCVHGRCFDGLNSFSCTCTFGWSGDLCDVISDACSSKPCVNGDCYVSGSSYSCTCNPGYTGQHCDVDINECESSDVVCNGNCINTEGSYQCTCGEGFTSEGDICVDINECEVDGVCEHECVNNQGSFLCLCGPGLTGDFPNCVDVDECLHDNHMCSQTCRNTMGSYECTCNPGYNLMPDGSCEDINECTTTGDPPCAQGCDNLVGSFKCSCPTGQRLHDDGITCVAMQGCQGNPNVTYSGANHLLMGIKSNDYITKKLTAPLKNRIYFAARFNTLSPSGVVMAIADQSRSSSAYVMVSAGNLVAGIEADGVHASLTPTRDVHVADGDWHVVKLRSSKSSVRLIVDGSTRSRTSTSGTFFSKDTMLHIGGIPANHSLMAQLDDAVSFRGCFASVQTKGKMAWTPSKRQVYESHVGCIPQPDTTGVYFYGTGYARFDTNQYRRHIDFKLRVKVRTSFGEGLIVSGSTRNGGSYSLALVAGKVVTEVRSNTDDVILSAVYHGDRKLLCDGLWMTMYCRISAGKISLYVDGKAAQTSKRGPRVRFDTRSDIFVGGLKGDSNVAGFHGSVKSLRINDANVDIRDSQDFAGVNMMGIPPR
uniref:Gla4 gamma-carboxyglutamic acid protein 4 n=1 Tax=Phallusia mammillata TaxID=59560 RepID=A0A6F9DE59_9ASCI|nr:Gla4 gamma-carboxyglutamic acid protein 4 [Phallusia mammillata]